MPSTPDKSGGPPGVFEDPAGAAGNAVEGLGNAANAAAEGIATAAAKAGDFLIDLVPFLITDLPGGLL
ncbi:hypothetical protein ACKVMT_07045 [Halobacteriales archaeon Cl-PHB]